MASKALRWANRAAPGDVEDIDSFLAGWETRSERLPRRLIRGLVHHLPRPISHEHRKGIPYSLRKRPATGGPSLGFLPLRLRRQTHKKERGCIAASPILPLHLFCEVVYRFFFALAFFFAGIVFSSQLLQIFRQQSWRSAYSTSCIVIARALVKRKVIHPQCFFEISVVPPRHEASSLHSLNAIFERSVKNADRATRSLKTASTLSECRTQDLS
jgi:hypothetical protein